MVDRPPTIASGPQSLIVSAVNRKLIEPPQPESKSVFTRFSLSLCRDVAILPPTPPPPPKKKKNYSNQVFHLVCL